MNPHFRNKPLHLASCILLFWKGISVIACILMQELGILDFDNALFYSTGFMSAFGLMIAALFSAGDTIAFVVLTVVSLAFLAYWVFFVLLAINQTGAGVASVGLLVFCVLDLPITVACSFEKWWSVLVCVVFHAAVFITVVLLRRSRQGVAMPLSKMPTSI